MREVETRSPLITALRLSHQHRECVCAMKQPVRTFGALNLRMMKSPVSGVSVDIKLIGTQSDATTPWGVADVFIFPFTTRAYQFVEHLTRRNAEEQAHRSFGGELRLAAEAQCQPWDVAARSRQAALLRAAFSEASGTFTGRPLRLLGLRWPTPPLSRRSRSCAAQAELSASLGSRPSTSSESRSCWVRLDISRSSLRILIWIATRSSAMLVGRTLFGVPSHAC